MFVFKIHTAHIQEIGQEGHSSRTCFMLIIRANSTRKHHQTGMCMHLNLKNSFTSAGGLAPCLRNQIFGFVALQERLFQHFNLMHIMFE